MHMKEEKNTALIQFWTKPSIKKKLEKKAASKGHTLAAYQRFKAEKDAEKDE